DDKDDAINCEYCCKTPGETTRVDISTDCNCCEGCVKNSNCIEWAYTKNLCFHLVNRKPLLDICDYPTLNKTLPETTEASGVIRCSD
ncbi:5430_t:CDS:2, partial [Racocetra fulgida]